MTLDIQDIINSASVPALIKDDFIKNGTFARTRNGDLQACVGGFSIVFPVEVQGNKWAFRCWHHTLDEAQARIKLLSSELSKIQLPYFIDFVYSDQGIVVNGRTYPTTRMKWINGRNIKDYICHYKNDAGRICRLAKEFYIMTQALHEQSIAHGDLQHENILVNQYGKIFLIDYDSMFVPALSYFNAVNTTNGKDGYQHPARINCKYASKKLDYFSEVVILISILAIAYNPKLVEKYDFEDSDCMLFQKSDFKDIVHSAIYKDLSSIQGDFNVLLKVLVYYLKKNNIEELDPLEVTINKASPNNAIILSEYLGRVENVVQNQREIDEQKRDDDEWQSALRDNSMVSYHIYLKSCPNGKHIAEANTKIANLQEQEKKLKEDADWNAAINSDTIKAFESFKQKYPRSSRVAQCDQHIEAKRIAYQNNQNKKRDNDAWSKAQLEDTKSAYQQYINNYPNGIHLKEANSQIASIDRLREMRIVTIIVVTTIVLFVALILHGTQSSATYEPLPSPPSTSVPASNRNEQNHIMSTPPSVPRLSSEEVARIEKETDNFIKGMEAAKSAGSPIDYNIKNKVNENLKKLNGNSSKYQSLKNRYERL